MDKKRLSRGLVAVAIGAAAVVVPVAQSAQADVQLIVSSVLGSDGKNYAITNHISRATAARSASFTGRREWLVVWAGDENIADTVVRDTGDLLGNPTFKFPGAVDPLPGPDFLAVIDATKGSPTYGRIVNTVTVPLVENEPHHMQYSWHKGHKIYAGGLFTDITFVFDVAKPAAGRPVRDQPADRHPLRLGAGRLVGAERRHGLQHLHGRPGSARPVCLQ